LERSLNIAIKYKSILEELNKEIEKFQKTRNLCLTYTTEYRDALKKEVELQKEKLSVLEEFEMNLERQLNT